MLHRMMMAAALCSFALLMTACESAEKTEEAEGGAGGATTAPSPGMLNTACPVSGMPVDPDAPTVDYAGGKVGFCCGGCPARWEAMSEADKEKMAAAWAEEK